MGLATRIHTNRGSNEAEYCITITFKFDLYAVLDHVGPYLLVSVSSDVYAVLVVFPQQWLNVTRIIHEIFPVSPSDFSS